ncbi:MAG: ribosome biogenesis GTP-binding protein YihA/YsxC [Rhodothermales bacterium]|nr:ribosome biogenesis GTP-binding protein YihA/YsxC [Rhodothermales bacterium]
MTIRDVRFTRGAARWEHLADDGLPEVAFIGRSNVGKSSLLNMLTGRRALARTSGTPGKTQEFNYYLVDETLYFVDLPGLGYAKISQAERARWERFIVRYITEREPLRLVVQLIDCRHPPTSIDRDLMHLLKEHEIPTVIALTKADKLSSNQKAASLRGLKEVFTAIDYELPAVFTSATQPAGRDELLRWIGDLAGV